MPPKSSPKPKTVPRSKPKTKPKPRVQCGEGLIGDLAKMAIKAVLPVALEKLGSVAGEFAGKKLSGQGYNLVGTHRVTGGARPKSTLSPAELTVIRDMMNKKKRLTM